jgi:hypothetical protein
MRREDFAELYTHGWADGDASAIMRALADDYVFDNPRVGNITKPQFEAYFEELQKMVEAHRTGSASDKFMTFEDQATADDGTTLTGWVWWRIPGTPLQGAGLVRTTDAGVVFHRSAYYAAPQS